MINDLIPDLCVRFTLTVQVKADDADKSLAAMLRDLADDFEEGQLLMTQPDECAILENPDGERAGAYVCHPEMRQ